MTRALAEVGFDSAGPPRCAVPKTCDEVHQLLPVELGGSDPSIVDLRPNEADECRVGVHGHHAVDLEQQGGVHFYVT